MKRNKIPGLVDVARRRVTLVPASIIFPRDIT